MKMQLSAIKSNHNVNKYLCNPMYVVVFSALFY